MPKVLIADALSERATATFFERGVEAHARPGLSMDQLVGVIGAYDGLAVRSATTVTAELLGAAARLKVVGRAGIGVDNIDVPAATARGIAVMNTPFGNAVTTAEHAIALILTLARRIPSADRSTRAGRWEKSRFVGLEVAGKTLGLIGCGNIGSIVADRAQGLKMRVIVYDPHLAPERAAALGVSAVEFHELLAVADIISLHTPLTDATRNLLAGEALAQVKPGVRIINCARGGLIDEAALYAAIVSGRVAGAALDVFAEEPARDSPLFELDEVVVTPHLGASTVEAQETVAVQIAEQMSDYLVNGAVSNAVNMPSISLEEAPQLIPYLALVEQLGNFAGQSGEPGMRSVTITYGGHAASLNTKPLTAQILQAVLRPLLADVNHVSAPLLAHQRGIVVTTVHKEHLRDYQALIRLEIATEKGERTVAGTLFGGTRPRLVEIDGVEIEAPLGAHMLLVRNRDQPGLIGAIGTILGDARLNIATFHLGRRQQAGDAIALVEVDQPVAPALVAQIGRLPQVVEARMLRFPSLPGGRVSSAGTAVATAAASSPLLRSA